MSKVTYTIGSGAGGAALMPGGSPLTIELKLINTFQFLEEPVIGEDQNYICSHYRVGINAVFNPGATSAKRVGTATNQASGFFGHNTREALAYWLMQPRGLFTYQHEDGFIQLQNPANAGPAGAVNDARNGPIPVSCDVDWIGGTRTLLVSWVIDLWIVETGKYVGQKPIVSGHTWEQRETLDSQYFATRVTAGRVVVDASQMSGLVPDDYRFAITPPIPGYFKRVQCEIIAASSGLELLYRCVDREMRCSMKKNGIADYEVINHAETVAPELSSTINTTVNSARTGFATGQMAANAVLSATGRTALAEVGGWAGAAIGFGVQFAASNLGKSIYGCTVRVYGTRQASMAFMQQEALKIMAYRLSDLTGAIRPGRGGTGFPFVGLGTNGLPIGYNTTLRITHDPKAGVVEVVKTHTSVLSGLHVQHVVDFQAGNGDDIETTIGTYSAAVPVTASSTPGASAPIREQSRGAFLGNVLAQQLNPVNARPAKPRLRQRTGGLADPHR